MYQNADAAVRSKGRRFWIHRLIQKQYEISRENDYVVLQHSGAHTEKRERQFLCTDLEGDCLGTVKLLLFRLI